MQASFNDCYVLMSSHDLCCVAVPRWYHSYASCSGFFGNTYLHSCASTWTCKIWASCSSFPSDPQCYPTRDLMKLNAACTASEFLTDPANYANQTSMHE